MGDPTPGVIDPISSPSAPAPPTSTPISSTDPLTKWFLAKPRRGVVAPSRSGVDVEAYINYVDYYAAVGVAIDEAQPGALILVSGWALDLGCPVASKGGMTRIGDLLAAKGAQKCAVRVLLSGHLGGPNVPTASWFDGQPGCAALVDDRLRLVGCFHQKAVFVEHPAGPIGFVGGMDFDGGRLAVQGRAPWHDVHVRLDGQGAIDLQDVLADRWETSNVNNIYAHRQIRQRVTKAPSTSGQRVTQVVRTYGNPRTAKLLASSVARPLSSSALPGASLLSPSFAGGTGYPVEYRFSPGGDSSIHDLLLNAIRATEHFIYVEDQYFVASAAMGGDHELRRALSETIAKPDFKHMLVLTCGVGTVQGELYQTNRRRRQLWDAIASAHPDRMSVWAYKGGQDRCYWQHAKTWIFDDTFAVVGSANFNRRGLSHDGELGVGIFDPAPAESLPWPHELRVRLWTKHLPTPKRPVTRDQVVDFEAGRKLWVDTPDTYLAPLDLVRGEPGAPDTLTVCDPKRPKRDGWVGAMENFACAVNDLVAPGRLGEELQWDLIVDPDGT